ncbi:hypothetical protein IFM51744_10657 [Aspergillus udagawae]|nr:hypothetical protein IFM51744_10657 [Aspergillus udagawae]
MTSSSAELNVPGLGDIGLEGSKKLRDMKGRTERDIKYWDALHEIYPCANEVAEVESPSPDVKPNLDPNTDPGYISILYGGFRGRAGSFRISLADIKSDKQLFLQMRAAYAKRQHRLWRRDLPHPWQSLAWLSWFDVKRLEFVKVVLC